MDAKLTDDELLNTARAGDEGAFIALYRRRQGEIYRYVLRMSRSESIAEDITQDVFMAVLKNEGNYKTERGKFRAYLYAMARNMTLTRLKKYQGHISIDDDNNSASYEMLDEMIVSDHPLDGMTKHETIETVKQAIAVLPLHYREVVVLCDLNEVSYIDAAQILECSIGTVRSRLHRARAILMERLSECRTQKARV